MQSARRSRDPNPYALVAILLAYFGAAVLFGFVTPVYEGPDEVDHVLYVKHIAEGLGIPVQSRQYAIAYGFGQEGSQAPLYYAINAALVRVLGLSLHDLEVSPPPNPFTVCGRPLGHQNVAGYRHDPRRETFPFEGAARAVHVMRLLSAFLGVGTVAAVYASARLAFPSVPLAAFVAAVLVGLNPQFAFMGGVVNNDNLVNCLVAGAVALALYGVRRGFAWGRTLLLGAVCGLAPLAKLGGLLAAMFTALGVLAVVLDRLRETRRIPWPLIARAAAMAGVFFAVCGWWFVRNWRLYGDPTGMSAMLSVYGGRGGWPLELVVPELIDTFRSYWGAFSCGLGYPLWVYWFFAGFVGFAVSGWVFAWPRTSPKTRQTALLLALWCVVVVILWVRWNQTTFAPLGRLFFQASAATCPLLGFGLVRLTRRPEWIAAGVAVGLLALTLAGILGVVAPAYALPRRYDAITAPEPAQRLPDARFGSHVQVPGFELSAASLEPGEGLLIALQFQALRVIEEDYVLSLQLVSPIPGDETVLVNFNTYPGSGSYGTPVWQPGEIIVERYRLQVPAETGHTQAWRAVAILYDPSDGRRLPVSVAGQPAGDSLGLGLVRVSGSAGITAPPEVCIDPSPRFGEIVALRGADIYVPAGAQDGESSLHVALWWEALGAIASDYTVFVQLLDDQGSLVASGDGPPLEGGFPTSLWRPEDQLVDVHAVAVPGELPPGTYDVSVGLYESSTSTRLEATLDSRLLPDGAFHVGTWDVQ